MAGEVKRSRMVCAHPQGDNRSDLFNPAAGTPVDGYDGYGYGYGYGYGKVKESLASITDELAADSS